MNAANQTALMRVAAVVGHDGLPTSKELEEATRIASEAMEGAADACVRQLANVLYQHTTGYTKPEGKMIDGVWEPDPSQYFLWAAQTLAANIEKDRAEGGTSFHAQKFCKSWQYCWRLAEAYLADAKNLPGYVAKAASNCNFEKIRQEYADAAAKKAEKYVRALAKEAEKASPEFKAAQARAAHEAKLGAIEDRIAGLEDTIKQYEKKMKRARTLLKKAKAEQKRALKKREGA